MNIFGKFLTLLGAEPPDSDFWYQPVRTAPGSFLAQFGGGGEAALRIGAVNACIRVRSETMGSLPCMVYRRTDDGREVDRAHPLYRLLHDTPNDDMSAFEFWQTAEQDLLTAGNFYARVYLTARADVQRIVPLTPSRMQVKRDRETGIIVYLYTDDSGVQQPFTRDEILHIPGLGYNGTDRVKGMSPIAYMAQTLDLAGSAETYGSNFFHNNATPSAYISHPNSLSNKTKDSILDYMLERFGGVRKAGKLGILEEGMKIETVQISHTDMQFVELRKFQIEEIARWFGVPLHMIGELARSTNNNIEHQGLEWVTNTIRPQATRYEKRLNMQLFGPREADRYFVEFNLDALLRGDSAARAAFWTSLRNIGAINANEIRAKENLNPYPGGEVYMVQGAMIPVEMAGKQQQQKAVVQ